MKSLFNFTFGLFPKSALQFLFVTICIILTQPVFSQNTLSLGNKVWYDYNDNGILDAGEPGVSGMQVGLFLDNDQDGVADAGFTPLYTTTEANGRYSFTSLAPGKYFIKVFSWSSHYKTTVYGGAPDNDIDHDNNGYTQNPSNYEITGQTITLTEGSEPDGTGAINTNTNRTYDFGVWKDNGLGDFVWLDNDGDGIQDAGEPGIANVTVNLLDNVGGLLATTVTDVNGKYFFHDLPQYGSLFQLQFITPAGYAPTKSNEGADDEADSDPVNGKILNVSVPHGQWNHSFDAGFQSGSASTLPVRMNSFVAFLRNNKVDLNWMTDFEHNSNFFAVEKSTNGREFKDIAIVMAGSNTTGLSKYSFTDNDISASGILYYRLRIADKDGRTDYSDVKIIRLQANGNVEISVFPNPVTNQARITVPEQWFGKPVIFQVISSNGIIYKVVKRESSSQTEIFDFSDLSAGSYVIKLTCSNQTLQQVIIK